MPACFQLIDKETHEPTPFFVIDAELCWHFQVECDEVKYHAGWYDWIGWRLATGKSFDQVRADFTQLVEEDLAAGKSDYAQDDQHLIDIVDWLARRYESSAWREVGRR